MNKSILLPKLAITGIKKNGIVYGPYILTTSFSIAMFFIFSAIASNDLMKTVPYANYVQMMMGIGEFLLGVILVPFLFYTNSFLIKRRKKEMGLYTILGLEKKHMAVMFLIETVLIYIISFAIGIITATIFSKLIFLMLMHMADLPLDTKFTLSAKSFRITAIFFGVVSGLNLITNLKQVTKTNSIDLLKANNKGEKEPKHLWLHTVLGIVLLGLAYTVAAFFKVQFMILESTLIAGLLLIGGTYFLFTAGSISCLKALKKNKKFYYKKENYITVSGILYRMKKSAASLSNICIFGTMIILTVVCTVALWVGQEKATVYTHPYDVVYKFEENNHKAIETFNEDVLRVAKKNNVNTKDRMHVSYVGMTILQEENKFLKDEAEEMVANQYRVRFMTVEEYNRIEGKNKALGADELLFYSTTQDFEYDKVILSGKEYKIKEEIASLGFDIKQINNWTNRGYYIIAKDLKTIEKIIDSFDYTNKKGAYTVRFNIEGSLQDKQNFVNELMASGSQIKGFIDCEDALHFINMTKSMNAGLIFIGIFFGITFTVCLILIMYYKQISEGIEDKYNFDILQKVGMSDEDIKKTIHRQIMLVFLLPLVTAIFHIFMCSNIIVKLMSILYVFDTKLILGSIGGVSVVFILVYVASYFITAKTYYKIIK
ncbi:MAG: FtsX-like permease family protein [Cellulosilyticaceae bacterium]